MLTGDIGQLAPQLLSEPGFGPLIAAKLVGEIAGAQRFATAAKLARASGVTPIPASWGNTRRQRLDHGGNRQINCLRKSRARRGFVARMLVVRSGSQRRGRKR